MLNLLSFELKYYFKNLKEAIQIIALFVSIVLLYPFSQKGGGFDYQSLAVGTLWVALILAISIGGAGLFQRDRDTGRLEYFQLTRLSLESVIFAKWLAYYLSVVIPVAITLPVAAILLAIPLPDWDNYLLSLALGALPLSMITAFVSAMMAGMERSGAILSLVVLPLSIPVIIFGSSMAGASLDDQATSVLFLVGFSAFMLPVMCLAGASCIRSSN
jgi:heme exporter protein B